MKNITGAEAELYKQIQFGFPDSWTDEQRIDRAAIEMKCCPNGHGLQYKAFSTVETYRAFGICAACAYAKEFVTEKVLQPVRSARRNAAMGV